MVKEEWYKEWFASEHYLDVYKHRNNADTEKIINLILSSVDIPRDAKILDAACGAGRHSIKLAQEGYNVTGFDLSKTLLDIAIRNAKAHNLDVRFIQADLRKFKIADKFDLIINLFTSFGYFETDNENFKFVKTAYELLKNKGYYILDYLNKKYVEDNLIEFSEKEVDDSKIEEHRRIANGRVEKKIVIKNEEGVNEYLESVKLYSCEDILSKISKIGFKSVKIFGDYSGDDFNEEESERCIIIFQK